jgi:alpha-galactosidase
MKAWIASLAVSGWLVAGVATAADSYTVEDFATVDKIDVHVHLNSKDPALVDEAAKSRFRLITINVDYPDFPPLAEQRASALAQVKGHPQQVVFAASFSSKGWDDTDWQQRALRDVDAAFDEGAVAVKVWKNIGMSLRDAQGKLVMVDDAKLDPIFELIQQRGKVLIGHQGEPRNCWLPLDNMTVNNDREYFREHPQYHMYLHPEMPSYEAQMAARDRMLEKHPKLKFMGAHMASLEWSVDELGKFLDAHPEAVVDLAARMGQVQFQSNADREKVRQFFVRYQDRLLYGTDLTQEPGRPAKEMRAEAHQVWLRDWTYLNTDKVIQVPELDAPVRGLALPKEVARKIYAANAQRWFGDVWAHGGGAAAQEAPAAVVEGKGLRLEYDGNLHSRVVSLLNGDAIVVGPYSASETLRTSKGELRDFTFDSHNHAPVHDQLGAGERHEIRGHNGAITKTVAVTTYDDFPQLAVVQATYTNTGKQSLTVESWTSSRYAISADSDQAELWSYQSGSYESRPDWVIPVTPDFAQDNFQGMNASDYGGGTPVVDVWRRQIGIGVGHLEMAPKLVALPVERAKAGDATLALRLTQRVTLENGASLKTFRGFVAVHHGDYFHTLRDYQQVMVRQGVSLPTSPPSAFEPIWCAWGYGRHFTAEQIEATLPVAKRLGFGWVTLDDGWQKSIGEWTPDPRKYSHGDADMKSLVDMIHAGGMKAQLWWSPLSIDPKTAGGRMHADELLLNADRSPRKISWWNTDYQCPTYEPVRDEAAAFVQKALGEWGFDGLKIDGQHLNGAPRCFNPAHHHDTPRDSVEGLPGFFESIWKASASARPDALVEICPCGTAYSFFTMPFLNMTVGSDPESSRQVRQKGKTLKALTGDGVAYFGDHVELSDGGDDFASTIGVGGVVGSNFVWPGAPGEKDPKVLLTPERERAWADWLRIYKEHRLPQGRYLGELYDIGFDRPEAHAIAKDKLLYYAFYAPKYEGTIELRGLGSGSYRVRDYEHDRDLGVVTGPIARVAVAFSKHLLLQATPEEGAASAR